MGFANRNIFPGGVEYAPEFNGTGTTRLSFNGTRAIQVHLEHLARLKDYLCARTKQIPDVPLKCHAECQVAQWSHSENVRECTNRALIDSVCKRCEAFHEIATQSVLLTERNLPEPVSVVLQSALDFENASVEFQKALAKLYVECRLNQ